MTTSNTDIKQIEAYLLGSMSAGDALVFRTKLLINPSHRREVRAQQQTYRLVKAWGRRKLKKEIQQTEHRLFSPPGHSDLRERITEIFPL